MENNLNILLKYLLL